MICALKECRISFEPKSGRQIYCCACHRNRAAARVMRINNPDKRRASQHTYTSSEKGLETARAYKRGEYAKSWRNQYATSPAGRIKMLATKAVWRGKKSLYAPDNDLADFLLESIPTKCRCCGTALDFSVGSGSRTFQSRSPSLDRVSPKLGYTKSNTVVICNRCNLLKGAGTLDELRMIVSYVEKHTISGEFDVCDKR